MDADIRPPEGQLKHQAHHRLLLVSWSCSPHRPQGIAITMALRSAALLARATTIRAMRPAPLSVATRTFADEADQYNPFTHSLDRLNTKKVS